MKKIFTFALVALAATVALSSCKKDNSGQGGDDPTAKVTARIVKMDGYSFSYNKDGKVSAVTESWDGGSETHEFTYEGNKLTIKKEGVAVFNITLNDKGLATTVDKVGEAVYTYSYDANNFCVSCKKDGVDQCQQAIDDYCVQYWTRINTKEDAATRPWRHKDHTYLTKDNTCGIHSEWAEDFGMKRWFYETGLLGRASAKYMKTAQWDDAEKIAEYTYEFDANGYITKETKMYGKPGALEFDDEHTFEWQAIN